MFKFVEQDVAKFTGPRVPFIPYKDYEFTSEDFSARLKLFSSIPVKELMRTNIMVAFIVANLKRNRARITEKDMSEIYYRTRIWIRLIRFANGPDNKSMLAYYTGFLDIMFGYEDFQMLIGKDELTNLIDRGECEFVTISKILTNAMKDEEHRKLMLLD
jgi:hypothetical protein